MSCSAASKAASEGRPS
uniref:Uncharacterized protein n=1 Tax=Arundo donax TaxID=35708 RepID=A0A0A9G7H7_ARUDO